jgi:hypothetical protein
MCLVLMFTPSYVMSLCGIRIMRECELVGNDLGNVR